MKYDWILFDADETLFHFDAFKGMQLMFARKGVEFTEQDFHQYQEVNKRCGWITKTAILLPRSSNIRALRVGLKSLIPPLTSLIVHFYKPWRIFVPCYRARWS